MQKQTGDTIKPKEESKKTESVDEMVEKEKKECESCKTAAQQVDEYKGKYLRAVADYQNFERRIQEQRMEWTKNANKDLILKLLGFLDDMERAEIFVKDENLIHVKSTFYKMLKGEGLEEMELLNTQYDPHMAEVITVQEGKEDNVVVTILRKGYLYNGHVLRVAQVAVSKKS